METFCECKLLTDIKYFKSSINQPKLIQKHFLSMSFHTFYLTLQEGGLLKPPLNKIGNLSTF